MCQQLLDRPTHSLLLCRTVFYGQFILLLSRNSTFHFPHSTFLLTSTDLCYIIKIQGAIGKRSAHGQMIRNNRDHVQLGRLFLFAIMERYNHAYPCRNGDGKLNKISPCYVIIHYTSLLLQKSTE